LQPDIFSGMLARMARNSTLMPVKRRRINASATMSESPNAKAVSAPGVSTFYDNQKPGAFEFDRLQEQRVFDQTGAAPTAAPAPASTSTSLNSSTLSPLSLKGLGPKTAAKVDEIQAKQVERAAKDAGKAAKEAKVQEKAATALNQEAAVMKSRGIEKQGTDGSSVYTPVLDRGKTANATIQPIKGGRALSSSYGSGSVTNDGIDKPLVRNMGDSHDPTFSAKVSVAGPGKPFPSSSTLTPIESPMMSSKPSSPPAPASATPVFPGRVLSNEIAAQNKATPPTPPPAAAASPTTAATGSPSPAAATPTPTTLAPLPKPSAAPTTPAPAASALSAFAGKPLPKPGPGVNPDESVYSSPLAYALDHFGAENDAKKKSATLAPVEPRRTPTALPGTKPGIASSVGMMVGEAVNDAPKIASTIAGLPAAAGRAIGSAADAVMGDKIEPMSDELKKKIKVPASTY
jgi:uncharacterized small protein (DUF1192 family)